MNSYKLQARKSLLTHKKQFLAGILYIILYNLVSLTGLIIAFQSVVFNTIKGCLTNGVNFVLLFLLLEYYSSAENRLYFTSAKISRYFYCLIISFIFSFIIIMLNLGIQVIQYIVPIEMTAPILFLMLIILPLIRCAAEYLMIFYIAACRQQEHVFRGLKSSWHLLTAGIKEVACFELRFCYYWMLDVIFSVIGGFLAFFSKNSYFLLLFLYPSLFGIGIVLIPYYTAAKISFCKDIIQRYQGQALTK